MIEIGWSDAEFAQKIDWEGGITETLFVYGLSSSVLKNQDGELAKAVRALEAAWNTAHISTLLETVEDALDNIDATED